MAYFETKVLDDQVKALPTYKTASGSIATFTTDMTENLISCVVEIDTGGNSSVTIRRNNKNLISLISDTVQANRQTSITINSISDNSIDMTSGGLAYACFGRFIFLKAGTYTVSLKATASDSYTPTATVYRGSSVIVSGINNTTSKTFTISADGNYELRMFATGSGDTTIRTVTFYEIQIEKDEDKTEFVAYNGTAFTINFGQTIYGGTVDVITGKIIDGSDVVSYAQNTVEIPTLNGTNNVFADTGDINSLKYILSVGEALS